MKKLQTGVVYYYDYGDMAYTFTILRFTGEYTMDVVWNAEWREEKDILYEAHIEKYQDFTRIRKLTKLELALK